MFGRLVDWLVTRYTRRQLARRTVLLFVLLLTTHAAAGWYFGNMGLSMRSAAPADDDRTVVLSAAEHRDFARHYSDDHEVGWCLYGSVNTSHIRITDVVPARADEREDRIHFTCVDETVTKLIESDDPTLLGAVHSHPSMDRSYLSSVDIAMFGRASPVIEVMGVYTEPDGVEFFTEESLNRPLDTRVFNRTTAPAG